MRDINWEVIMKNCHKILIIAFTFFVVLFSACKSTPETKPDVKPVPEKITEKEKPQSAEDLEKTKLLAEIDAIKNGRLKDAKEKAVSLEADTVYPDKFAEAEETEAAAEDNISAENLKEALAKYNEAADRYEILSNLMQASSLRKEIEEFGFARFAPDEYVEAERLSLNTLEHYELDYKMAKETSEDAVKLYEKTANKGYFEFAKTAKAVAKESKADCDSIKVARSRTEDYNNAVRMFNAGKAKAEESDFRAAFHSYNNSAEMFRTLYTAVSAKRAEAEAAMQEAARKQQESSNLALEADKEAPLTEAGEGFSEEEIQLEDKSSIQTNEAVEDIESDEEEPAAEMPDNSAPNALTNGTEETTDEKTNDGQTVEGGNQ